MNGEVVRPKDSIGEVEGHTDPEASGQSVRGCRKVLKFEPRSFVCINPEIISSCGGVRRIRRVGERPILSLLLFYLLLCLKQGV